MDHIKTKAAVLHGPKDIRIEARNLEPPGPEELQIAIRATGLCGSDLHYYNHFRNGNIVVQEPLILGHESAGEVVKVGTNVASEQFKIGDRVVLEVGIPCEKCELCLAGRYNICEEMRFRSSARVMPHAQGTLQEVVNHPARWCHKMPDDVSFEEGALVEPLGVAIHAHARAGLRTGSKVLVLGAGAVGMLVAAVAKIDGASQVVIGDLSQERVDFAVQHGFADRNWAIKASPVDTIEEQLKSAKTIVGTLKGQELPSQYDAVFECTGAQACLHIAIYASKPGGKVMLIGMGTPVQTLPISDAALREIDLVGVFRYSYVHTEAIEMIKKKSHNSVDFAALITHTVNGLENVEKAFDLASKPKTKDEDLVLKVILRT